MHGSGIIADGSIELFENGTLLTQFSSTKGRFKAKEIKPKTGSSYRIVVTSNGKQIEAETTIPNKAEVVSVDTTKIITDSYNSKQTQFNVKIKDQEGDDFYRIIVSNETLMLRYNVDGKGSDKYYLEKNQNPISSDDPVFNSLFNNFGGETMDMGPANDDYIFPDDYFKNKEYSIHFRDNSYSFRNYFYRDPINPSFYTGIKLIYERNTVHILKLSKELYNYMKYLRLYNYYHDDPFSEPVPVYSNIKNGIGIFAGFNDDAKITFEKKYVPFSMDTIKVEGSYNYGGYSGYSGYTD